MSISFLNFGNISTIILYMLSGWCVCALCQKGALMNEQYSASSRHWNRYYYLAYVWLILIATVRNDTVGSDMATFYVDYFKSKVVIEYDWGKFFSFHQYEPGFQVWFFLLRRITDNYRFMYFCTYSFVAYAYVSYIKRMFKSEDGIIFMQLFFFYFTGNMSGLRAAMGISFVILSLISIFEKRYIRACILTLFGMMFHYTMMYNFYIIFANIVLENIVFIRKKFWWFVGILGSSVLSVVGLEFVQSIFEGSKYDYYFVDISQLSFWGSLIYVILAIFCIYHYYKVEENDDTAKSAVQVTMSFLITYPMLFLLGAYRIPYYYVLPRLKVWSKLQIVMEKYFTGLSRVLIRLGLQLLIWMYLLLRYYKSALDGHFAYHIF